MPDPKKDPFMRSAVSEGDNAVFSQVSKMEIEAYDKKNQKTESRKVSINPENYARSFSSRTKESEPRKMVDGRSYVIKTVEFIETLTFDLWFDNTGVIPDTRNLIEDLNWLEKNLVKFDGEMHATRYINIIWGPLNMYRSQLKSLQIQYLYFNQNGEPLRAKASLSFEQVADQVQEKKIMNEKKSPDLTHMYVVKAGENLPMMCHRIYNDAKYYLKVAEANGLSNFTNIEPGQKIYFPPLL